MREFDEIPMMLGSDVNRSIVKQFITSRLTFQRKEMREKIRFLGKEQIELFNGKLPFVVMPNKVDEQEKIAIYRQALSDVLNALGE